MTLVEIADADGVRLVTWNRPDALNALNDELWDATRDALVTAQADPELRCVVHHRHRPGVHGGAGPRRDDGAAGARRRRASTATAA